MSEPTFTDKMQSLVAKELSDAHGDPDRLGEAIERLANSLGLVIAVATKGNPKGMDVMLTGATSHLYECATGHAKLAAFMARVRR